MIGKLVAALTLALQIQAQPAPSVFTSLYSFTGANDGGDPEYQLLIGPGDVLYGTTYLGGAADGGTAFSLTPPSTPGGAWTETTIQTFSGPNGTYPSSGLSPGRGPALYGVTLTGGYQGAGAVYALTPPPVPGNPWNVAVIYSFPFELFGPLGVNPWWGLWIGKSGLVFGVTFAGGANAAGTAYSLTPGTSAPWTENTIYTFGQKGGASGPGGGLLGDSNGVLYGVSGSGGIAGHGTVYSLTPPASHGGVWTESVLYSFPGGQGGAFAPYGPLTAGPGRVLYGAALYSTPAGAGVVFSLTPPALPAGAWTARILQIFPNGLAVDGGVLLNSKTGVLYGAAGGGTNDWGILFELQPPASGVGPWTERVLHTFNNTGGRYPNTPVMGTGGMLYGTTIGGGTASCMCGTVYSLQP